MILYVGSFLILSFISLINEKIEKNIKNILLFFLFIILLLFIGLRHEVGGDWITYKDDFYSYIKYFDIYSLSYKRDFGYELISYIIYHLGFSIHIVNLLCASIFLYALFKLGNEYNNYIIILLIAFPQLIIVGAMGYTKQATAFAFIILSFLALKKDRYFKFLFYSFLSIIFHKSAIAIILLLILSKFKLNLKSILLLFFILIFSYYILLMDYSRILSYILTTSYRSEGVYYRIIVNIIPSIIFILLYRKFDFNVFEKRFILLNIIFTFLFIFFASNYSTFVDRFVFYFAIIQLLVFPKFIFLNNRLSFLFLFISISYYFILMIGWFMFANHSSAWVPYNNLLLLL
tara:strand:- start:424 stop:1461 length:1038 start_codon:yes stop_codon:yes gene_type:complete